MATGYDRFVRIVGDNKFFTDATGAFRGVILDSTDCGTSGFAVRAIGHKLIGEVFSYFIDRNGKMQRHNDQLQARNAELIARRFSDISRNALDYVERKYAY